MEIKKRDFWRFAGAVVICFLIGVCLGILCNTEDVEVDAYRIGIGESDTDHFFSFQLKESENGGSKLIRMQNGEFLVSGMLDLDRHYFDGYLSWGENDYYLYDYGSGEYRLLSEKLCSFLIGDYYVRCEYKEKLSRMDLLIFYCPKD